ncbi:hypothetical protein [Burkholderia pseudomultivorans]|uniref:hypothetical protein n=1 Tax=Burkholderia pseudomultivorans TaxID=1207504 RepID=UPI0007526309|nr:hypothetical protein [Burkholderia pseudomultivorans]KWF11213.1 hypothetical protein WT55_13120 [Burkholderia pseudomultivorans]
MQIDPVSTHSDARSRLRVLEETEISLVSGGNGKGPMEICGPEWRLPATSVPSFPQPASHAGGLVSPDTFKFFYQLNRPFTTTIQAIINNGNSR